MTTDSTDSLTRAKALFHQGLEAYASGDLPAAEGLFREVLALAPGRASALVNLGGTLVLRGKFEEAADTLRHALRQDPLNPEAHLNLSLCQSELGDHKGALISLATATRLAPDNERAQALFAAASEERYQEGLALYEAREFERATQLLTELATLAPAHYGTAVLLGLMAHAERNLEDAARWLERAVALDDADPGLHASLGTLMIDLDRLPEALSHLDRALAIDPKVANAHYDRGCVLQRLGRLEDAVRAYDLALAQTPDREVAINNKGIALHTLGKSAEALACFDLAIQIRPDYAEAHNNRGFVLNSLKDHRKLPEALASLDRALALNPEMSDAWGNRGNSLMDMGQLDDALANYERAIEINPQDAKSHWNKALVLLLQGRLAEGWPLYEWRWHPELQSHPRSFAKPLWLGEQSLAGKTLLVHVEQGYGDTLQMCRFTRELAARGARVILEVLPPLRRLLTGLEGVDEVVVTGEALPDFDFHCPFMSLPLALRLDWTSLGEGSPYLRCPDDRREAWAKRLGPRSRSRIGIAWSGNAGHKNDVNRSIQIDDLMAHLPKTVEWISLQKDVRPPDRALVDSGLIRHFGEHLHDFTDTAALCTLVDQVVTVDTSVAHLAGALGCKTTVMLPFVPDWRWLLDREDSPWYASVRLLRQGPDREWGPVLRRLADQLTPV